MFQNQEGEKLCKIIFVDPLHHFYSLERVVSSTITNNVFKLQLEDIFSTYQDFVLVDYSDSSLVESYTNL